jgi:hypothetical protein
MPHYYPLLRGDKEKVWGHEGPEETQKLIERYLPGGTRHLSWARRR